MAQGFTNNTYPSATTGTGSLVYNTGPTINQPNIVGVTNGSNATAGSIGEVVSSVIANASSVTMNSNAATNLTSISLTAGDWDVWGNINYKTVGTSATQLSVWISTTSATLPDTSLYNSLNLSSSISINTGVDAPYVRINISGTTTVYLSGYLGNSSGNGSANGGIFARRAR